LVVKAGARPMLQVALKPGIILAFFTFTKNDGFFQKKTLSNYFSRGNLGFKGFKSKNRCLRESLRGFSEGL